MASNDLGGIVDAIYTRIGDLERRFRNSKRTGTVSEVDLPKGLARVDLGAGLKTGWVPWGEIASGAIKTHIAPSVGQQVDVLSANGDMTDAVISMSVPSNANPRPHDGPEAVITMGGVRIEIADDAVTVTGPKVVVVSPNVQLGGEGGPGVARIGDLVSVSSGSSAGMWPIVEGSGAVFAID